MKPFERYNAPVPIHVVAWPPRPHLVARGMRLLKRWRERARQRRALACLDDRTLRDIGITRVDALAEANKPFWR